MSSTSDSVIQRILNEIGAWLANVISRIGDFLWQNFEPVFSRIASWLDSVFQSLKNVVNQLGTWLDQTILNIKTFIEEAFSSAFNFLKGIYDRIADSITNVFDNVVGYLQGLYDSVVQKVVGVYEQVTSWLSDVFTNVTAELRTVATNVTNYLGSLYDTVKGAVGNIIQSASDVVTAIYDAVKSFISNIIDTVGNSLRDLLETIAELPDVLAQMGSTIGDAVEQYIGKPLSELSETTWRKLSEIFTEQWAQGEVPSEEHFKPLFGRTQTVPQSRAEWQDFFANTMPKGGVAAVIFNTIISLFLVMRIGGGIADANAQVVLQEFGQEYPYNIPSPPDTYRLKHFRLMDEQTAVTNIRRQGYSEQDAVQLLTASETLPPEGETLAWWLRNIIDESTFNEYLTKAGWSEQSIASFKEARFFIPPVQDLITMAVREVFSPDIAEQFGQFEDYPTAFTEWASKQGVSEEWAKNYWAAHWALPSPQMGFEMFQRRIITQDELVLLLKALDVMPFWRDKLIDLSYSPLTRVDVRRMHAMGVIDNDQVRNAYLDLGYSPENAELMLEFTVQYNAGPSADNPDELHTLTRTSVLNFYGDGLMTRTEALDNLLALNYSRDAAELYLTSIDLDQVRRDRKDAAQLVIEQFKAGLLELNQVQEELARQQLEQRELVGYLTEAVRIQVQRTKSPSKADLDKFYVAGLIPREEYLANMRTLGYSDKWGQLYIQLLEAKANA